MMLHFSQFRMVKIMIPWWQNGVIYQIYPRSFMDASGDGIGDLQGVMSRLDYLEWLGIDAIWFSPIFPSPMADFGYDVADYRDIHPDYGTLSDFDKLLAEAHKRNIRIILDLVPNHTSAQHPWFIESRSSRDNPKRNWYIWRDPKPDGSPPNNWMAYFGGPAWTLDQKTGQYYMHNFDPGQPELNYRNPEVAQAIFDVIRFWLSRGVDGFRMDVIDRILKDEQFRDNPPNPDWKEGDRPEFRWRRVFSEQMPGTHDYMKRFRAVFDEFPDKVSIGEVAYDLTPERLAAYYGSRGQGIGDELHLPFNFGLILQPWNTTVIRRYVDDYYAALPDYGWPNFVLGNHDVPRIATRIGAKQARLAAMLLLTLRGTPTLYYGDEIGMEDVYIPQDLALDPQGKNGGYNRDAVRTPMQWDASPNAGFADASVTPWLRLAPNHQIVNVAAQRDDPNSMLAFVRRLLVYRRQNPVLTIGSYTALDSPGGCFVFVRQHENQRALVALNITSDPKQLHLPGYGTGTTRISTHPEHEGDRVDLSKLSLNGDEGVIIELKDA